MKKNGFLAQWTCSITRLVISQYQDNAGLTDDQKVRLRNITIALGLLGSLGASLEKTTPGVPIQAGSRGLFSFVAKGIAKVFTAATVVATVVAVIVVPVVTLISPVPVLDSISVAAVAGVTVVSPYDDGGVARSFKGTTGAAGQGKEGPGNDGDPCV
ncbi:MAG: hypothetical protein LBP60_02785 [Spirochaetaceae bacterium]|jgi:hypothetical protein|nr:hypothetical protein [Spirochaetaceae bacterium]